MKERISLRVQVITLVLLFSVTSNIYSRIGIPGDFFVKVSVTRHTSHYDNGAITFTGKCTPNFMQGLFTLPYGETKVFTHNSSEFPSYWEFTVVRNNGSHETKSSTLDINQIPGPPFGLEGVDFFVDVQAIANITKNQNTSIGCKNGTPISVVVSHFISCAEFLSDRCPNLNFQIKNSKNNWSDFTIEPRLYNLGLVENTIVTIPYCALPSGIDWTNEPFSLRLKNPDGSFSGELKDFYFLTEPKLDISHQLPTCSDSDDGKIIISDQSEYPTSGSLANLDLRVDLCKLDTTSSTKYPNPVEKIDGVGYYWNDQATVISIRRKEQGVVIDNSTLNEKFRLGNGIYMVKAFLGLCPVTKIIDLTKDPLVLDIPKLDTIGNSAYHIKKNGGSCTINGTVTGAQDGYKVFVKDVNERVVEFTLGSGQLPAGTYSLWAEDGKGCRSKEIRLDIKEPKRVEVEMTSYAPKCHPQNTDNQNQTKGSIRLMVTKGGIPNFKATLSGNTLQSPLVKNNFPHNQEQSFSDLSPGTYKLEVRDQGDEIVFLQDNITIEQKELILTATTADAVCFGEKGFVTLSANIDSKPLKYLINNQEALSNKVELVKGIYTCRVEDANGCKHEIKDLLIGQPEKLVVAVEAKRKPTCALYDGELEVTVTGGLPLAYDYTVTLNKNDDPDFVTQNTTIAKGATNRTLVFTGLAQGSYTAEVVYNNTCQASSEKFNLEAANPLSVSVHELVSVNCPNNGDGLIVLSITGRSASPTIRIEGGGYTLSHAGGDLYHIPHLNAGVYHFTITDERECTDSINSVPMQDRTDQVKLNSTPVVTAASCGTAINGAINIQASGGVASKYRYLLSNGNTNSTGQFDNLAPNSYTVTVTDGAGCTDVKDIVVPANPNPVSIAVTDFQHQYCSGGDKGWIQVEGKTATGQSLTFSMAPGGQSLVNPTGKVRFGNLTDGLYTITATDNNNCMASASQSITNKNLSPNVSQTVLSPLACSSAQNGRILTTVTDYPGVDGGHNFLFSLKDAQGKEVVASSSSPLQREFGNLSNQTYSLVVTDQYNCSHVNNQVTVPRNPLEVKLADGWVVTPTSCLKARNGTITVSATDGVSLPGGGYHFNLNDGNTTVTQSGIAATFKGLGAGEYQLTVVDAEGCSTTPVTISVPVRSNSLSLRNPMATPTKCFGGDDGSIAISIENDDAPGVTYTYGLMRFEGGAYHETSGYLFNRLDGSFSGLTAGKYCIKVVGDDGCDALFHDIVVGQPTPVLITDRQYCCIATHGAKNGSFAITAQEGSKEYLYEWVKDGEMVVSSKVGYNNGEGFNFQATGLEPGHYTFRLSDVNQCAYFDQGNSWYETSVEITQPQYPLDMTVTVVQERCHGSNDGAINIRASGGWLCSDNHHPGCGNPAHNNCSAWVESPCGIQADYLFSINGGGWQCSPSFDGLTPGTYTVKVKDRAGNEVVREVTLLQRPQLEIVQMDTHPASCPGYANGRVDATIENGVLNGNQQLQYSIINSNTKQLVISLWDGRLFSYGKLPKGDYQLLVTDFNGCIIVKPFSITEPEPMSIAIQHNYIKKKGDATGEIRAMATKGNGQFRYQWFRDQGTNPFAEGGSSGEIALKDLVAGTYTLYVGDTARCDYEQTGEWMKRQVVIEEPEKALRFTEVNKQEVSCFGLSDGQIELQPEGGWGGYAYVIDQDPQQTSPIFSKLKAGSYKITVTDRENSSWDSTIVIAQPDRLTAELLSTKDIKCFGGNDGSILLDIKGGNLGYQVSVDLAKWQDGHAIHNLTAGVYTMYVKDRLGCRTELKDTQLQQPGKLVLASSALVESRCSNNEGAISTSHSGGVMPYVFQWKKDTIDNNTVKLIDLPYKTANINALYSSKYSLLVTDAHGCTAGYSFMLGDITDLTIESIAVKDVSCMGYSDGEAKAFVTKGNPDYFYTWDTKIATHQGDLASGLAAGSYSLMVRDVKNCAVTKEFTIGTPDSLLCRVVQKDDPLCEGGAQGSLLVQAKGGTPSYHYVWDHGAQGAALNGVEPGNYRLTLSDAHQCKASFTYPFQYRRTLKPSLGNDTTICHYNSLAVDGGNYQRFVWSSDNGFASQQRNVSLTQPGVYCLKVADADNCLGYDTLAVEVSRLSIDRIDVRDVSCHGVGDGEASIALSPASPPCTIVWPDRSSATHWKNLSGGEYPVSVFDAFGCIDTKTFKVVEPSPLAINVDFMRDPLCWGVPDGIIKTVGWGGVGNYQYQWGDGSTKQELSKLDAGRYTLQIKDGNLCTTRETFDLAYSYAINPQLGSDLTLCRGNSAKLWPGEFRTYKWFHNNDRISTDTAVVVGKQGAYHVEVTDSRGCLGRDTLQILMRDTDLNPQFLSASGVAAGDTLIVVEVSQPKPIKIEWAFSGEHKIIESGEYYCKVVFGQPGSYAITLNAYSHNCFGQARRLVLVTPPSETPGNGSENPNGYSNLLSLKVSPNPTDGFFEARVELTDDAPLNIYLVSIASGQIMEQRKGSGMKKYSYDFNIAIPGLYLIVAESKGERRVEKMIVK